MEKELTNLIKKVSLIDIALLLLISPIIILFKSYDMALVFDLGLLLSMGNFITSTFITSKVIKSNNKEIIVYVSYAVRILVVASVGAILTFINTSYSLIFVFGFTVHYISFLIYGVIFIKKGSE
ncbi:ATP synthase protein I [Clostridium amylolyticum]|uniref:ATP synthase protein I n=1 Tax=Clostridium amylolyticum TaxID=1121298 RepID=A0A1M6B8U0_9CLOT|nr:ATP synthase subunit I [Clostridium amylolyticum]SHI45116.1 ATP synthase protein I [Clostridium amylolyticum]